MQNEAISSRNVSCLLVLMVLCGSFMSGIFTVAQDSWIAIIVSGILYLPLMALYSRICMLFPGKNLYEIVRVLFGKFGSVCLAGALTFYSIIVTAMLLRYFVEFTVVIALQDTPRIPLMIVLILTVSYLASQGAAVLGRWSFIICIVIIGNVALTVLIALNTINFSHLMPVLEHKWPAITSDAFTLGIIVVGETLIAMLLFGNMEKSLRPFKVFIPAILLGLLVLGFIMVRNLLILGADMEQAAKFSTYMAIRVIHIGDFFERIESSISFAYVLLGITKMGVYLSAAAKGISDLTGGGDERKLLIPVVLLVLTASAISFTNIYELFYFFNVYRYWALPFQVVIPFIIWIVAEIKAASARKLS